MYTRFLASLLVLSLLGSFVPRSEVKAETGPTVVINELLWMGSSRSAVDEWIELRNVTPTAVDLAGWFLTKKSNGVEVPMLALPDGAVIPAHGFFLVANYGAEHANSTLNVQPDLVDTDVSLVNSALQVKLYDAANMLVDTADDGTGAPLAGQYESGSVWKSMERIAAVRDGTMAEAWRTATTSVNFDLGSPEFGTPRAPNGNEPPAAEAGPDVRAQTDEIVMFDGSESSDLENDPLTFAWDFGDGIEGNGPTPTHRYLAEGRYTASLTVSDGQLESTDTLVATIEDAAPPPTVPDPAEPPDEPDPPPPSPTQPDPDWPELPDEPAPGTKPVNAAILLNELLPNPAGRDQEGEFVELFNPGSNVVPLTGWSLTDGKKTYRFLNTAAIEGSGFLVLPYATTRLLLRNSGGELKLVDPFGKAVSGVAYPEAVEASSFSRTASGASWNWTTTPTPGSENEITAEETDDSDNGAVKEGADSNEPSANTESGRSTAKPRDVSVSDLDSLPSRTLIRMSGTVAVPPGLFSKSAFWIADETGAGLEVASSASLPELRLNESVTIVGTVSTAGIGRRVNLQRDGLTRGEDGRALEPTERSVGDLTDDDIGALVRVEGVAREVKRTKFMLEDADGGQIEVAYKRNTGLNSGGIADGQTIRVAGLLGRNGGALQLWPRVAEDVEVLSGEVAGAETAADGDGAPAAKEVIGIAGSKRSPVWPVAVVIGLMAGAGGWLYFRQRRRKGA